MSRFTLGLLSLGALAASLATPAFAQSAPDEEKGIYAVARIGATVNPDQKLDGNVSIFQDKTKYKTGITGEIGGGYDFGMFRLEQTVGYSTLDLNQSKASVNGFSADGRTKMFTLQVGGYIDIPLHSVVTPYIGAGVGVARIDARASRLDSVSGLSSSYNGKDYGFLMHGDAGIGVHVAPKTTVELGARYTRINSLTFKGQSAGVATTYKPIISSLSGTLGVRYTF